MTVGRLSAAFLDGLAPAKAALLRSASSAPELESQLAALVQRGQRAWPTLGLEGGPEGFMAFLAKRAIEPPHFPHLEDLFLCYACVQGATRAMAAFEDAHFANLPLHLAQLSPTSDFLSDLRQTLRAKLFVAADGQEMGLAAFSGRGPLGAWFRVTALHTALKLLRSEMKELRIDAQPIASRQSDPERDLIQARMREELQATLREVLAQLPANERALLRLHFLNGSTLEELTKAFDVSRATIARWIASARQSVLKETQRRMVARLKLSPSELASAFRMTRSDWLLSLDAVLGPEKKKEEKK